MKNPAKIFQTAEAYAESLTSILDITEAPVNINLLFRIFKIQPKLVDFINGLHGYANYSFDGSTWNIAIDEKLSSQEQRIVLLHEIFHIQHGENISNSRSGLQSINEHAANQFAEAFLMPTALFKRNWEQYKSIEELSKIFYVPQQSVENRLITLGL